MQRTDNSLLVAGSEIEAFIHTVRRDQKVNLSRIQTQNTSPPPHAGPVCPKRHLVGASCLVRAQPSRAESTELAHSQNVPRQQCTEVRSNMLNPSTVVKQCSLVPLTPNRSTGCSTFSTASGHNQRTARSHKAVTCNSRIVLIQSE